MSADAALWHPEIQGSFADGFTPSGEVLDALGLTALAMPPGRVESRFSGLPLTLQVAPLGGALIDKFVVGDAVIAPDAGGSPRGRFDLFAAGVDFELVCENPHWELLLEFADERVATLAAEAHEGEVRLDRALTGAVDEPVRRLAALAIEHLRSPVHDRLYVEGLSIALGARALGRATGRPDETPVGGTERRVGRAMEYARAHLGESLSVAELAEVACMSPSWFARAFRAAVGVAVYAWVREARLERARELLTGTGLGVAEVAARTGFADQSHLTRAFRRRYGTTPARVRGRA